VLGELTRGELRVMGLVALGLTNKEVADELGLRPKTVEWTLTNVYRKLCVRSRTELALRVVSGVGPLNPGVSLDEAREAGVARLRPPGWSPSSEATAQRSEERRSR
jgi:DNA-binding CsgD family transcriptional regulator